jgi:hypothetical protein
MSYRNLALRLPRFLNSSDARSRDRLDSLSVVVALLFAFAVLVHGVPAMVDAYTTPRAAAGDFKFLLSAGKLVLDPDAKHLYDGHVPNPPQWGQDHGFSFPDYYPYAPGAAYATSVLTLTSQDTALDLWRMAVLLSSFVLAAIVASAFRSWPWRIALFVAIVTWEPILLNARIGQTGAFIAALTAVGVVVFLRHRQAGAAVLALLALKPTAAIGPALMAFSEKTTRIWGTFMVLATAVVMLPFVYLGKDQFTGWLDILHTRGREDFSGVQSYNQGLTSLLGRTEFVVPALGILMIAAVLVSERVHTRLGLCGGAAFAIFAGALLNPHSLLYDWGSAFVGILLLRKSGLVREGIADLAFGVLAITLFIVGQGAWSWRAHDFVLRPLTGWTLLVTMALLYLAWRRPTESVQAAEKDDKPLFAEVGVNPNVPEAGARPE